MPLVGKHPSLGWVRLGYVRLGVFKILQCFKRYIFDALVHILRKYGSVRSVFVTWWVKL